MNIFIVLLLCLTSIPSFATNEDFQIHFSTLGPKEEHEELDEGNSFQRKSQMVYRVDEGVLFRTYIKGLEVGLDGVVDYYVKMEGINRNPKVNREFGGTTWGSRSARVDEMIVESQPQMLWKTDVGFWDFKITVTDRVTGQKRIAILKGVEVKVKE